MSEGETSELSSEKQKTKGVKTHEGRGHGSVARQREREREIRKKEGDK
jgi:hypothetical protein